MMKYTIRIWIFFIKKKIAVENYGIWKLFGINDLKKKLFFLFIINFFYVLISF